jgi:CHAT domain-containing protein/Tfp pilus assembly protein PilF
MKLEMLNKFLLAFVLLIAGSSLPGDCAHGQAPSVTTAGSPLAKTEKASEALARAKQIYSEEGARAALPEFEKALALFRTENDRKGEAITIGLIGNCYKGLGDFPKALEHLRRALSMKRELGDRLEEGKTLNNIGLFYWETSQYQKALEPLDSAVAIGKELGDHTLEAAAHNNLGLVYDELGDYRRSLNEYNRALELYRGMEPNQAVSNTIGNVGGRHLLLGEYAQALTYYQQSLAIDERLKLKPSICLDLENIGLCYVGLGRAEEAIQTLDRALSISKEAGLKKEEADCQKAKGSALMQLGRYTEALEWYRQARQTYEQVGLSPEPRFKQQLIEALGDLGNLEVRLGDVASAEKDFRRAIEISEEIKHPRGVTINLIALGDLEWRRKRFPEAAALYRQALARAKESDDRASTAGALIQLALTHRDLKQLEEAAQEAKQARELAQATQARPLEAQALYAQGEIARALGRNEDALTYYSSGEALVRETGDPELAWRLDFGRGQSLEALKRNEEALAAYQNAVKTIEQVRSGLREERFRAGYLEDKYQVYVALVELLLKLGHADEAFVFAEKLRARSYLDMLNRGQPPIRNPAQRQTESSLQNRIRELQRRLEEENAKSSPDQKRQALDLFSKELGDAERDYENFLDDLRRTEPTYAAVRALSVPSGKEVEQRLPANTALIEYVLGEENLVIFVLTSDGLRARTVPVRAVDLEARVDTLRELILHKNTNEWKLPAASLYRSFIAPVEEAGWLKGIKQLYIIPHAILHYVPFAALAKGVRTGSGPGSPREQPAWGGGSYRVLVDDYVLEYLPAAATLVYTENAARSSNSVLAMAPSSTRLQYTQSESQSVSEMFPRQHMLLLGPRATESSFKRLADRYDVIHLATHGYFNKLNPLLSGVMLERDAQEDGRLEVHEILELKLNAELVTLSACDTALGSGYFAEVPAGDDLVGLTRAFMFAGAPSVLASLWEVNDRSAVQLMQSFYGHLRASDKATALTKAQREMRGRGLYRHPYYWGAFTLVGRMN